jgi:hypothetical protein
MGNSLDRTVVKFLSRWLAFGGLALMVPAALAPPAHAAVVIMSPVAITDNTLGWFGEFDMPDRNNPSYMIDQSGLGPSYGV